MKKIKGYYHILLVNHYEAIINEQITCMVDSGLYDAAESIHVGMLGGNEEFDVAYGILKKYPKFIIEEYSTDKNLYEFHTLNILKQQADKSSEDYYLFYFHTKGISFPDGHKGHEGGNYWRRHMNEYTLNKWKDNVSALDLGYETCGTQLRPKREWRQHYSGTFAWARSEYVKLLKPIYSLDIRDRFEAEFWLCSAHPIAATLSQVFVDYYHYGINRDEVIRPEIKLGIWEAYGAQAMSELSFTDAKKLWGTSGVEGNNQTGMMFNLTTKPIGRNIVHTLCWGLVTDVERAVKSLYELNNKDTFTHVLVDLGFPLFHANEISENIEEAKKLNSIALKAIAEKYGSKYVQMKNEGVSQNWSTIAKEEGITDNDVLICCDPDEMVHPKAYGWVEAIGKVIRSDKKFGVVSLMMEEEFPKLNKDNSEELTVDGIRVIDVHGELMWPQIGISGELINKMGGIPYPQAMKIYGGLESAIWQQLQKLKYKWCLLPDYLVAHPEWDFDSLLRQWKHYVLQNNKSEQIPFEKFLELKKQEKA